MTDQVGSPMPRYRSHKEVCALKISESREVHEDGSVSFAIADAGFAPFKVAREVVARYMPSAGDYIVVYADGYVSVSPAKAFEDGYTQL
jgi:hypothetical protein